MDRLQKDFISKEKILQYLTEEDIFEFVFGHKPVEFEYITSPFREDNNPGCWFSYSIQGKLRFTDFGNPNIVNGINMLNIDCFDAIQIYFKLGNFYQTLEFLKDKIINGSGGLESSFTKNTSKKKERVIININARDFEGKDKRFWKPYGITKNQLIEDKVFPVNKMGLLNAKYGDVIKRLTTSCYAYTNFQDRRKKLYLPFRKGSQRFITNCNANDIGEIKTLPMSGDMLVISKSYKDCRVIKNMGYDSIWFQNEGMIPSNQILLSLARRFKYMAVLFDNDEAGINAGKKVTNKINTLFNRKAMHVHLPEYLLEDNISDPSDMYKLKGPRHLKQFLKNNL